MSTPASNLTYTVEYDQRLKLLIVDDDPDILESLQDVLEIECEDYAIKTACDINSANHIAAEFKPDIALLDIKLGSESGLDLIKILRAHVPDITCIMMTAYREMEYAVKAVKCGADDFLYKPLEALNLVKTLKRFQLNLLLLRGKAEAERRFRAVFNQSFQFLFVLDEAGLIQEINSTALSFIQPDRSLLLGTPFHQAPWWKDSKAVSSVIMQAMQGEIARKELIIIEDGKEYIFEFTFKPVKDSSGRLAIIIPEGRDITENKQYENKIIHLNQTLESRVLERTEQLYTAKNDAEKANRAKTNFFSNMSHELRTPLNAIIGFSHILGFNKENNLSSIQQENINHISTASQHLLTLINQCLDLSQIESGKQTLNIISTELRPLLNEALELVQPLLDKKSIQLNNKLSDTSFQEVLVDRQAMLQIIINLLSNAIKYSEANSHVEIKAGIENNSMLRLSISDTGPGIAEDQFDIVFDTFTRLSNNKNIEGNGIGLSICKQLIEKMNGNIGLLSTEGEGSTFWIDIPLSEPEAV